MIRNPITFGMNPMNELRPCWMLSANFTDASGMRMLLGWRFGEPAQLPVSDTVRGQQYPEAGSISWNSLSTDIWDEAKHVCSR